MVSYSNGCEDESNWQNRYFWGAITIIAILVGLILLTYQDYGVIWDANSHTDNGKLNIEYYRTLGQDRKLLDTPPCDLGYLPLYGGFFDVTAEFAVWLHPEKPFEIRHLVNAMFGLLGIVGCWRLALCVAGYRAAFWAALCLALTPSYYGHMFFNPKDIPFAAMFVGALFFVCAAIKTFPRVPVRIMTGLGVISGLTMGIRIGGLLIFFYYFVAFIVFVLFRYFRTRDIREAAGLCRVFFPSAVGSVAVAWVVMLIFWPWAHVNPIVRPIQAFLFFSKFPNGVQDAWYLPRYFFFKLPVFFWLVLLLSPICFLNRKKQGDIGSGARRSICFLILWLSILFPVGVTIIRKPNLYNAIRHFIFLIPSIAVLTGTAIHHLQSQFAGKKYIWKGLGVIFIAVMIAHHLQIMTTLHPYEYAYYNVFIGGIQGAYPKNYDIEYWGSSFKEGVSMLSSYLKQKDGDDFSRNTYRILTSEPHRCATVYFPDNFVYETDVTKADYYLTILTWKQHLKYQGEDIVVVSRRGVPFCFAKKLYPAPPGSPLFDQ